MILDEIKKISLLEWCILACITCVCASIIGGFVEYQNKENNKTMNYYYVYKEKNLVDTIKADEMTITESGALVFESENCLTIRILAKELWDDAELKFNEDKD